MRKRNYRVLKRAVCLLMTGAMVLTGVPTGLMTNSGVGHVYAEEYTVGESTYRYEVLDDGTIEITGYSGSDTEISIPSEIGGKKVTSIGGRAFEGCGSLIAINIPEGVTNIGSGAFAYCSSLKKVTIPEGVTNIEMWTFFGSGLTEVSIPSSVKNIGYGAFENCSNLEKVNISEGVVGIESSVFSECSSLIEINIPASATSIAGSAFLYCSGLKKKYVSESNSNYKSIDGVLFNRAGDILLRYPAGRKEECYWVPDGVTNIEGCAFEGSSNLIEVKLPEEITSIGNFAFEGCTSLITINMPEVLTSIGEGAFCGCSNLDTITIPIGIISIEYGTFNGCSSLVTITIPETVKYIADNAIWNCDSLKEIKIPKTVDNIGNHAIGYYYNSYTSEYERYDDIVIYGYAGTVAETYAEDNGFEFITIKETSDTEKNIVVEYPEDVVTGNVDIKVDELKETDEAYKNLNLEEKLADTDVLPEDMKFKVYDIKLLNEETNEVQPTGEVTVKLPCPEGYETGKCKVYHIDSEGNVTDMNAVYDGEYFVFTTNHFSVYLVTENRLKTNSGTIGGDVNGDGNIDTQDAVLLKKYLAG